MTRSAVSIVNNNLQPWPKKNENKLFCSSSKDKRNDYSLITELKLFKYQNMPAVIIIVQVVVEALFGHIGCNLQLVQRI